MDKWLRRGARDSPPFPSKKWKGKHEKKKGENSPKQQNNFQHYHLRKKEQNTYMSKITG